MAIAETASLLTIDGVPLKVRLARAERSRKLKAVALVLPLFLFVVITFLFPLFVMTFKSVVNEETFGRLDRTHAALADWDGQALPDEPAFAAFAEDLKAAQAKREVGEIAKRVNSEYSGAMSKFKGIARKIEAASRPAPTRSCSSPPTRSGATSRCGASSRARPRATPPITGWRRSI